MLYYLYLCSIKLETGIFNGRPAGYLFMLIFNWLLAVTMALFLQFWHQTVFYNLLEPIWFLKYMTYGYETFPSVLMEPMVMSVIFVWCKINKEDTLVNFWFGTQFKAMYLPWVLFGFNLIISGKLF